MPKDNLQKKTSRKYDNKTVLIRNEKIRLDVSMLAYASGVVEAHIVGHLNNDLTLSPLHIRAVDDVLASFGTNLDDILSESGEARELGDIRKINDRYQEYRQLPAERLQVGYLIAYVPRHEGDKANSWLTISSISEDERDSRLIRISAVGGGLTYFSIPKDSLVRTGVLRKKD